MTTSKFEKFNPYKEAKFKQSYTGDNQEFNLTKDGCPIAVMDEDGNARLLMGPAIFLKKSTMLNWFKSIYIDGVVDEELISYEQGRVILKVSLYKNPARTDFISSAHGVAMEKNTFYDIFRELNQEGAENSADLYNLAFYLGLKQALERDGFVLNYDPDFLMANVPGYKQACHTGEKATCGDEIIIQYENVSGPKNDVLEKEARIKSLETLVETKEPPAVKVPELSQREAEVAAKKEQENVYAEEKTVFDEFTNDQIADNLAGKDPIEEFLKQAKSSEKKQAQLAEEEKTEPEPQGEPEEMVPGESNNVKAKTKLSGEELGEIIFEASPTAGMKLKAYSGEKLKDIPQEALEYFASKKDWNGKISEEMLNKIKDYLDYLF